jgi:hypothetical protein
MSVASKLASFAVVLMLIFAGAALAGSRLDVHPGKPATEKPGMGAMDAPQPVRGLAVSEKGLTLQLARRTARQGSPFALAFRIVDGRGQTVRDFDVEHTKRMHLIVVRRDLTGFQHLHPSENADGTWSLPVTLPEAGTYRVFADFSVGHKPYTLADDIAVDGALRSLPLPSRLPTTWAPRATWWHCARATSRSCTCTPTRTACSSWRRSRPRAPTACSCSSRPPTGACTPPRSPRR